MWNFQPESIKVIWVLSEFFLWSYGPKTLKNTQKCNFTVILALFSKFELHYNMRKIQSESMKLVRGDLEVFRWSYGPETSKKHEKCDFTVVLALFTKFDSFQKLRNFQPESIKFIWDDSELFRWSYGPETFQKTRKCDFTVVLALFTDFWIFAKFGEFLARADKIGLGGFGVIPEKLWSI